MDFQEAIETDYKGLTFRSRTEARWAVFLDELGVRWHYQTSENPISFTPDFEIPDFECFVEVLGTIPSPLVRQKALALAKVSGKPVYVYFGGLPYEGQDRPQATEVCGCTIYRPDGSVSSVDWLDWWAGDANDEAAFRVARWFTFEGKQRPSRPRPGHLRLVQKAPKPKAKASPPKPSSEFRDWVNVPWDKTGRTDRLVSMLQLPGPLEEEAAQSVLHLLLAVLRARPYDHISPVLVLHGPDELNQWAELLFPSEMRAHRVAEWHRPSEADWLQVNSRVSVTDKILLPVLSVGLDPSWTETDTRQLWAEANHYFRQDPKEEIWIRASNRSPWARALVREMLDLRLGGSTPLGIRDVKAVWPTKTLELLAQQRAARTRCAAALERLVGETAPPIPDGVLRKPRYQQDGWQPVVVSVVYDGERRSYSDQVLRNQVGFAIWLDPPGSPSAHLVKIQIHEKSGRRTTVEKVPLDDLPRMVTWADQVIEGGLIKT